MDAKFNTILYDLVSKSVRSFFKNDSFSNDIDSHSNIISAVADSESVRFNFSNPTMITNIIGSFNITVNGNFITIDANKALFLGVFGKINVSDLLKFERVTYEIHNTGFNVTLDPQRPVEVTISNVTSFSIRFLKNVNGNFTALNPVFSFRILSIHNYHLRKVLLRLMVLAGFDNTANSFHPSPNFQAYINDDTYFGDGMMKEYLFMKKWLGVFSGETMTIQRLPSEVLGLYLSADRYAPLDWSELGTLFPLFHNNNLRAFSFNLEGSHVFLNFFDEATHTLDLIHIPTNKNVLEHVSAVAANYAAIVNGPFFKQNMNAFELNVKGRMVGFRKFRVTHNGMPRTLNSQNMDDQSWFGRKMEFNERDLRAKIISQNGSLIFSRDELFDPEVTNADCAFDGLCFAYSKELGSASPLNPESPSHAIFLEKDNSGNARVAYNGLPFIGIVTRESKKYIFLLILEEEHHVPQPFARLYELVRIIDPDFLFFTDGSDSVFLNFQGKNVPVGFGKLYKNRAMPCLIGFIEKSKL